jgi:hypothetical protein
MMIVNHRQRYLLRQSMLVALRRAMSSRARRWSTPLVLLGVAVCSASLPSVSLAVTKAPEVGYLPASNVSTTGATVEVPINPEGGETSYEISLECQSTKRSNQDCEPLTVGSQRQQGVLAPGFEQSIVTDPISGLQPNYLYKYRVIASNSDGREGYVGDGFLTCPSQGSCPSQPSLIGESLWNIEGTERVGREAARLEEEREAKKREEEERPAKEAAERAAKEREVYEAGERAGREAAERERAEAERNAAALVQCFVPRLKGDSLNGARRALNKAHCSLGRVSTPRKHHGALVVTAQGVRVGRTLAKGAVVAVKLGSPRR